LTLFGARKEVFYLIDEKDRISKFRLKNALRIRTLRQKELDFEQNFLTANFRATLLQGA